MSSFGQFVAWTWVLRFRAQDEWSGDWRLHHLATPPQNSLSVRELLEKLFPNYLPPRKESSPYHLHGAFSVIFEIWYIRFFLWNLICSFLARFPVTSMLCNGSIIILFVYLSHGSFVFGVYILFSYIFLHFSFLQGRVKDVAVNGPPSKCSPVSSGVPQGKYLGPDTYQRHGFRHTVLYNIVLC